MPGRLRLPLLPLLLASLPLGGCAGSGAGYPSLAPRPGEMAREIVAPGDGADASLAPEQQQGLRADVARERAALDLAETDIKETGAALDRALAGARGSRPGAESWSTAQMALSRFDLARAPLGDIRARLIPLERMVDSLPADNPDRRMVLDLAARAASAATSSAGKADAASRALGS